MTNNTPRFKWKWTVYALLLTVVTPGLLFCGEPYRGGTRVAAWRSGHRPSCICIRPRRLRNLRFHAVCPPDPSVTPEEAALEHPSAPTVDEVAWFRTHPEARARLLEQLDDPELDDDAPARLLLWSLLKEQVLMPSEIAKVLDQAFHLITLRSSSGTWWVFERRTAPEFVYITPQIYAYLRDGVVVHAEAGVVPGNGVEVHAESSGRGPFAGLFPVNGD